MFDKQTDGGSIAASSAALFSCLLFIIFIINFEVRVVLESTSRLSALKARARAWASRLGPGANPPARGSEGQARALPLQFMIHFSMFS